MALCLLIMYPGTEHVCPELHGATYTSATRGQRAASCWCLWGLMTMSQHCALLLRLQEQLQRNASNRELGEPSLLATGVRGER